MTWWTPSYQPQQLRDVNDLFHTAQFEAYLAEESTAAQSLEGLKYLSEARAALELERLATESLSTKRLPPDPPQLQRILTIMHSAPPHTPGGYTSRAHGLLSSLQDNGLTIRAHTRPGYLDETSKGAFTDSTEVYTIFQNVTYRHTTSEVRRVRGEYQYMLACVDVYRSIMEYYRPDVVHLRSTYLVALPGLIAAKQLGIPVAYEVSGLWELVYEGRQQFSLANRTTRLETVTMQNANQIATLTSAMRDVIINRGIPSDRVTIAPNAVSDDRFSPSHKSFENLPGTEAIPPDATVIGYAGSLVDYEGLDDLIRAIADLQRKAGLAVHALIVGGGPEEPRLKTLCGELGVRELVHLPGRVSPEHVAAYYDYFDICVLPRKDTPATRVVSPLKPFEIMASAKPMIVSDIPALKEISGRGRNAKLFRAGDFDQLSQRIHELIQNPEEAERMSRAAQSFTREHHTWPAVASIMKTVFMDAVNNHNSDIALIATGVDPDA